MSQNAYADIVDHLFKGARLLSFQRLTGGVSADVHRLDVNTSSGEVVRLVLRAHREDHNGHTAEVEYQLLQALHQAGLPVPEPLLVDSSGRLLANPFLDMSFIEGDTKIPSAHQNKRIDTMAKWLATIHTLAIAQLPTLPVRSDPLPELFDYLPVGAQWDALRTHLGTLRNTGYRGEAQLLHGDFWPENLLWKGGAVAAILDWEDAALGDPLSDVAAARVELRYKFGKAGMQRFTQAYEKHRPVDRKRLALWQVYVSAAAQRYMGDWGLEAALEAHMRKEALASIREAGDLLMDTE